MNQDPVFQRLREIGWRRALTETEQAELRSWLTAHPETQAEVDSEAALNRALASTRDLTVPTNFTVRVMEAIQRDEAAKTRSDPPERSNWWRVFLPRFAIASAVIVVVAIGYRNSLAVKQTALANAARQLAETRALPDISVMEDFETIRNLDSTTLTVDENLLAMSDDLLALNK
jgi:anti-sigma factor RsiW